MAKAWVHAESSARKFGGVPEDYTDIHLLLDDSKKAFPDNRHRAVTHSAWFIATIIPRVFGHTRVNSVGRTYSTVDVAEQHVLEDFGMRFIPALSDYLSEMEFKDWMNNGRGVPPTHARLAKRGRKPTYAVVDGVEGGGGETGDTGEEYGREVVRD